MTQYLLLTEHSGLKCLRIYRVLINCWYVCFTCLDGFLAFRCVNYFWYDFICHFAIWVYRIEIGFCSLGFMQFGFSSKFPWNIFDFIVEFISYTVEWQLLYFLLYWSSLVLFFRNLSDWLSFIFFFSPSTKSDFIYTVSDWFAFLSFFLLLNWWDIYFVVATFDIWYNNRARFLTFFQLGS